MSNVTRKKVIRKGRSRSLLLAILHYQYEGAIKSKEGKARSILYGSLFSLFPDAFGQRLAQRSTRPHGVKKVEKDAVMRGMEKDGLIVWHTSVHSTWLIELTAKGVKHLMDCMKDPRYSSDLKLIRDYFPTSVGETPQEAVPAGMERIGTTAAELASRRGWPLTMVLQAASDAGVAVSPDAVLRPRELGKIISEVLVARADDEEHQDPHVTGTEITDLPDEVVTLRQTDEGAEIAITPGWDVEPDEEHVGWALRDYGGDWHLNNSLDALVKGVGVKKVVVVYPLRVRL